MLGREGYGTAIVVVLGFKTGVEYDSWTTYRRKDSEVDILEFIAISARWKYSQQLPPGCCTPCGGKVHVIIINRYL